MMRRTRRQAKKEAEEAMTGKPLVQVTPMKPDENNPDEARSSTVEKKKTRPPPRKKRKVKGKENSENEIDVYEQDVVGCKDSEVFQFIIKIFQNIQHLSKTSQRRKFLVQMNDFYLKELDGHEERHQKQFATCLWHILLPVLQSERNVYSDAAFRFFKAAVLGVGQVNGPPDKGNKNPLPLLHHILYYILKFHSDRRPNVRVRIMHLLNAILNHTEEHPSQIESIREQLLTEVIQNRIRDKIAAVRAAAVQCLSYFKDDMTARQSIQFSSAYDPNPEVRRTALSFLQQIPTIKMALYIARAFDASEAVRTEAFLQISKLDFSRVAKNAKRNKLIDWGLSPSSGKAREVMAKVVLPHWLKRCNNNLVTLFSELGLHAKPKTARLIIDALYPEGSSKEYDEIDWTFLGKGQKLIPLDEITVEKAQIWLLLSEKFKDNPFCANLLLPEQMDIIKYIERFLEVLRDQQKEEVEDFSKYICFFITLKLCNSLNFEESVRREMAELLKTILLDPVIEDPLIVNTAIDLSGKLVDAENMDDYLVVILKEFFDSSLNSLDEVGNVSQRSRIQDTGEEDEIEPIDEVGNQILALTISPESSNRFDCEREAAHAEIKNSHTPENTFKPVTPKADTIEPQIPDPIPSTPFVIPSHGLRFQATSTPIKRNQIKVRDKLTELQSTLAETALERHHLINELDEATNDANYLKCHEIKLKVDFCVNKEKELQVQIQELKQYDDSAYFNASPGVVEHDSIIRGGDNTFASDSLVSHDIASMPTPFEADGEQYNIMAHSILKALTILLRFLNWTRKITPYLRSLFEYQVIQCLEDDDARVRSCTIYLYGLYGMLDKRIVKRSLLISLQALQFDVYDAKIAGFKSAVDLLISYPLEFFRPKAMELQQEDFVSLPPPFDDPKASNKDLQNGVITLLTALGGTSPGGTEMETRISGISKMLLAGRLKNVNLLLEFLCIWINPRTASAPAWFQIGLFIPMYSRIGASNASMILDAFLLCVKEICVCQEMEKDSSGLAEADIMKLVGFVAMNTDPDALARFDDGFVVHERAIMDILHYIKDNNCMRENQYLARSIKCLTVTKVRTAHDVMKIINEILESHPGNISGAAQLKIYLRTFLKQLGKKFAIELDSMEEVDEVGEGDEEEMKELEFLFEVIPKGDAKTVEVRGQEDKEEEMEDSGQQEQHLSISIS